MQLSAEFVNNLVAVLNVLASQVATALDTLNFALVTERSHPPLWRPQEHQETPDMGCGPASSRTAPRLTDPVLPHEFGLGLWTRHLPGTYRPYPRLVRHIEMLVTTTLVLGPNRCWIDCHRLVHLLPSPHTVAESQDRRRLRHLIRILMARYVRIQVPRRSGPRLRWFMVLGNFYKNSPLHFAMHTVNLSRHGHRVSWMRWCDGRKTRIPGPPIRP